MNSFVTFLVLGLIALVIILAFRWIRIAKRYPIELTEHGFTVEPNALRHDELVNVVKGNSSACKKDVAIQLLKEKYSYREYEIDEIKKNYKKVS